VERGGIKMPRIEHGGPWEIGYVEPFNGKMIDELPHGKVLDTFPGALSIADRWRMACNTTSPRDLPGDRPPAPEVRSYHGLPMATN